MNMQEMLKQLQKDYLAGFPEKISHIEQFWAEQKLDLLKSEFHKLKGSGRTYGLPSVTQLGEALEQLCTAKHVQLELCVKLAVKLLHRICIAGEKAAEFEIDKTTEYEQILSYLDIKNSKRN